MKNCWNARPRAVASALAGALAAAQLSCGGDGNFGTVTSSLFANHCAAPGPGDSQGTVADEKAFLRLWTDELYLWYREVPNPDPAAFTAPQAYFDVLKTTAVTSSGNAKDRFHFRIPTAEWRAPARGGEKAADGGGPWGGGGPTAPPGTGGPPPAPRAPNPPPTTRGARG